LAGVEYRDRCDQVRFAAILIASCSDDRKTFVAVSGASRRGDFFFGRRSRPVLRIRCNRLMRIGAKIAGFAAKTLIGLRTI
jgi:hypothetical protein